MSDSRTIHSAGDLAEYEKTLDCVHCGLCLASCPTYELFGRETTSPRGRIYVMRGLAEGAIEASEPVVKDLDLCLVCRACEPVCPSGVKYGEMMEFTRTHFLEPARPATLGQRVKRFALRSLIPYPRRLRLVAWMLWLYEAIGLRGLLQRYGVLKFLSPAIALRDRLLPTMPPARERRRLPKQRLSGPGHRGRVAMLEGCVMPLLLGKTNRATMRVLAQQGFEVVVPKLDVCCGALGAHFGQLDVARATALKAIEAFRSCGPVDAIIVNSAGCGAAMKEYGRLLDGAPGVTPQQQQAAREIGAKVKDVSEFLSSQGIREPGGRVDAKVAYADACHLAHAQGVKAPPRELLAAVPGVELVPLERSDRCCGAAGLYNVLEPEASQQLLEGKLVDLDKCGATIVSTANPGCMLQYAAGLRAAGSAVDVLHPIELFDRAIPDSTPRV